MRQETWQKNEQNILLHSCSILKKKMPQYFCSDAGHFSVTSFTNTSLATKFPAWFKHLILLLKPYDEFYYVLILLHFCSAPALA